MRRLGDVAAPPCLRVELFTISPSLFELVRRSEPQSEDDQMAAPNPAQPSPKPLHHHVLEGLEHIVDRFGMYMAIGAMLIIGATLFTVG